MHMHPTYFLFFYKQLSIAIVKGRIKCMDRNSYEKINDLLYIISEDVRLILSVKLVSRGKQNVKYNYHQEFLYNKYDEQAISIKREATPFLIFKVYGYANNIVNDICLGVQHFEKFYETLLTGKNWFNGTWQVFYKKDNKLHLQRDNKFAECLCIGELYDNKWITIEPIICIDENDIRSPGVRFNFNNVTIADITVDRFYGLLHILTGFNMYNAMSSLLTYVNTCNPGTNMTQFSPISNQKQQQTSSSENSNSQDNNYKRGLSFFDLN